MAPAPDALHILIVDDHEPTARLIETAFQDVSDSVTTHVVARGRDCLDVLAGQPEDGAIDPDFVMLDLGLPDIDGIEVLEHIRNDPDRRHLPIVVFSGQTDKSTVRECYTEGANTFVAKPDDFDEYRSLAQLIVDYWGTGAKLPPPSACS